MCGIVAPQDYALQLSVTWYVLGFPMTSVCVCVWSLWMMTVYQRFICSGEWLSLPYSQLFLYMKD